METLKTSDFYFELPKNLIAQTPLENRSSSRLLTLNKQNGHIEHKHFFNILEYLNENDCIVLNDTKVIPARLIGERGKTGAKVEILLLKNKGGDIWETLVYPGKKAKPGDSVVFGGGVLKASIIEITSDGNRLVKFDYNGIFEQILDSLGEMPLPPYITEKLNDKTRYQTVYAKEEGSAAAPTAGLHFTDGLLSQISGKGVKIAKITLHVGLGTFRPVKAADVSKHKMHSEFYNISQHDAGIINSVKASAGKIISVGTTSTRTLEYASDSLGYVKAGSGYTDIFIYPPYKFKVVDTLITNFHLPESTLMMLVSALAGRENILNAYEEAVKEAYRFFSFGDAMCIY